MAINIKSKTIWVYAVLDFLFLACAGLHLAIPLMVKISINKPPTLDNVAQNLLLDECPLTVSMVNASVMFLAFVLSIPTFVPRFHSNRRLLPILLFLIGISALLTLIIGLNIWYTTLQTRANLAPLWNKQSTFVQSMLQFKFKCCGYSDRNVFIADSVCPNIADAVRHGSCEGPFSVFANQFLDVIFTAFFGFCVVDVLMMMAILCVAKERREIERYALIDEKIVRANNERF